LANLRSNTSRTNTIGTKVAPAIDAVMAAQKTAMHFGMVARQDVAGSRPLGLALAE